MKGSKRLNFSRSNKNINKGYKSRVNIKKLNFNNKNNRNKNSSKIKQLLNRLKK